MIAEGKEGMVCGSGGGGGGEGGGGGNDGGLKDGGSMIQGLKSEGNGGDERENGEEGVSV